MITRTLIAPAGPFDGPGLHGGATGRATILPARTGGGVTFVREVDGRRAEVPARLDRVVPGPRRTALAQDGVTVSTVEHLMAALGGLGIHDAEVHLRGAEVPILDGSAAPFARALLRASAPATRPVSGWTVTRAVTARAGRSSCHLLPARRLELWCQVELPGVGRQSLRHVPGAAAFISRLAPARTFGYLSDAARLQSVGLARGAGLGNVLVLCEGGVVNPGGSRFWDEPVRHKLLDALGDLALLGGPLRARVKLVQCSHRLLTTTLRGAIQKGCLIRDDPEKGGTDDT